MKNRRKWLIVLGSAILLAPCIAVAQQPKKIYRVGWLSVNIPTAKSAVYFEVFKQALRELGYVEGQNVIFEKRWADGKTERLPALAAELVALNPHVIVSSTTTAMQALHQATTTIPIVMTNVSDPVGSGFAASLAHPGGNITGLSDFGVDLAAKKLELIRELVPRANRIGVLTSDNPVHPAELNGMRNSAKLLGFTILPLRAQTVDDLDHAFASMTKENLAALIVLGGPPHSSQRERIAELAVQAKLPTICPIRDYVEAGGLLSYGPNILQQYKLAATYADKILKGAKPGDLPVEQPTRLELIINGKTAKAIELQVPVSLLVRADEVIQ